MRKLLLALVAFAGIATSSTAQYRCGTDVMNNRQRARNPFLVQAQSNYEQMMREEMLEFRQNRDGETEAVLVIPVVFHVLHMNGPENITDAQILDQMFVLNRDYNKLNADTIEVVQGFDTIIANVHLEFRLATKDPLGNCTNGIERIYTIETFVGDNGSKLNQWPRERYLNVWTVADMENGVAGYSQYPSAVIDEMSARADGVIIRHDYIGRIGTGAEYASRALTHEIGHWLDLAHPWGSTNDPEVECGDDGVTDTPVTEGHASCTNLKDYSCNSTNTTNLKYTFEGVDSGLSGTTDPTAPPAGFSGEETFARMVFSPFTASGVSANPVADSVFAYSGWSTGALDQTTSISDCTGALSTTDYYEFTITPRPGTAMTLTDLSFKVNRSATGPRTYAVRSSINGFANNLTATISPANTNLTLLPAPNLNTYFINTDTTATQNGSKITLTGANYTSVINPITFRIYGWNAEDAFGSFGVDDVQVNGNFGAIENVQNYMDYSYCSHMFTNGQKQRMRLALASALSGRNQLYTAENRALTGTDDNPLSCAPEANFFASAHFACIGDNITFTDNSTNGAVDTYSWTFEDGTPATSNAENPVVSFNSYGRKTVTLTVLNANGSTTKTIEQCVVIGTDGNEFPGALLQENFDSYDEFYNRWYGINHDNNMSVWQQTAQAGFSNNTSAKLNAFDMDVTFIDEGGQDIDELASGVMDLSDVASGAVVSFKWAFATQSTDLAGITDALEVYISNDCGRTWSGQPRLTIEGTDLVTAGSVSTSFTPSSAADWEEGTFTIPNTYYNDGFRMKFVFLAGDYPNNLYIDDINMSAVVSVEEQIAENFSAVLYPNPATSTTTLSYINVSGQQMNIQLMDLSGRVVRSWNPMTQSAGVQQLVIDTEELSKGVYMLNLRSDSTSSTLKLMVK